MMKNTNSGDDLMTLKEKNPAWYDARLEVLNRLWDNKIDFETFEQEIAEVDMKYKHPDDYIKKRIEQLKGKFEDLKKENGY